MWKFRSAGLDRLTFDIGAPESLDPGEGTTLMNKRRRLEDQYEALLFQSRLFALMRLSLVLVPALLAIAFGYAIGPYLGPLF
jgi:hypothetical protein